MRKPFIKYLVSSPDGDIPVNAGMLDVSLECDPYETPYRVYFQSIEEFLKQDEFIPLLHAASRKLDKEYSPRDEISEILIRAEKHGLLYHPASIELILGGRKVKFGLNVAVTDTGKTWLREEISLLQRLHSKYKLPYLPEVHISGELNSFVFLLEDWFEGYHEFHLTCDEERKQKMQLWKFGTGYLNLTDTQGFEIYRQASKILTLYYDPENFNYIYPWHHAAGDFIVKMEHEKNPPLPPFSKGGDTKSPTLAKGDSGGFSDKTIDVRLTTARRYRPLLDFQKNEINPLFALFYFFLHLSLHMRLDKIDGVGEVVWAKDYSVDAAVQGFLEALRGKNYFNNYPSRYEEFIDLLRSFTLDELKVSFNPLLDLYAGTKDLPVIGMNLDKHAEKLYHAIQIRL